MQQQELSAAGSADPETMTCRQSGLALCALDTLLETRGQGSNDGASAVEHLLSWQQGDCVPMDSHGVPVTILAWPALSIPFAILWPIELQEQLV